MRWPAFHEAAHCSVGAGYFGHRIKTVWIGKRDGGYSPDTEWRPEYGVSEREFRLQEIIILQAGRAALDHLNNCKHYYDDWEAGNDHKLSWKRALWLSDGDEVAAGHLLAYAMRRAELLVDKLWPQIYKLAFTLLEHLKLDAEQIEKTLAI